MKKIKRGATIAIFFYTIVFLFFIFSKVFPETPILSLHSIITLTISLILTLLISVFINTDDIKYKLRDFVEKIKNHRYDKTFRYIKNFLAIIGLLVVFRFLINIKTYDIRLGYENDNSITLIIKKLWGLKTERYLIEFNDERWRYWTDNAKTHKWARISKESKLVIVPEKAGIFSFLPEYEDDTEYNPFP